MRGEVGEGEISGRHMFVESVVAVISWLSECASIGG